MPMLSDGYTKTVLNQIASKHRTLSCCTWWCNLFPFMVSSQLDALDVLRLKAFYMLRLPWKGNSKNCHLSDLEMFCKSSVDPFPSIVISQIASQARTNNTFCLAFPNPKRQPYIAVNNSKTWSQEKHILNLPKCVSCSGWGHLKHINRGGD